MQTHSLHPLLKHINKCEDRKSFFWWITAVKAHHGLVRSPDVKRPTRSPRNAGALPRVHSSVWQPPGSLLFSRTTWFVLRWNNAEAGKIWSQPWLADFLFFPWFQFLCSTLFLVAAISSILRALFFFKVVLTPNSRGSTADSSSSNQRNLSLSAPQTAKVTQVNWTLASSSDA